MDHSNHDLAFSSSGFMPHGHCYLWKPELVGLHVISDLLIGFAYVAISVLLYLLVRRIRLPFGPIFIAFGVFIGACGMTHFMEVWTLWNANYWFSGVVKAVTAMASVATGFALHRIAPKVMEFAHSARLSEERKMKLEAAHAELSVLYEKVKESDQIKTQFFANVSHELRTPLALILGPLEVMQREENLTEPQRQRLNVVLRNSKTLLKHVNDLLDLSKLEAGQLKPRYTRSDLVRIFRYVAAHFETVMQTRQIFFSLHAPESILMDLDSDKIQRVFTNLLSNSVKFIPDGGRIRVSIQEHGENAVFQIEDTGPGVDENLKPFIFERFRQGDGGVNRRVGGTGLGLAIVKDLVEAHRGSVRLVQEPGHGAKFEIEIPKHAPQGVVVEEANEAAEIATRLMIEGAVQEIRQHTEEGSAQSPNQNLRTVLICEDNPDMNQFIADTLAGQFNVIRAINGVEGLEKAKAQLPDLIVSDIMMPYMSGDQLVREIQKDPALQKIPVLLLSARADDEMRIRLLREGAQDYLVKPFAPEELRARASNLVNMKVTHELLEKEANLKSKNVVDLATELISRKREAELAYEVAQSALTEAQRASEVKTAFLSLISHELNTPLMAMNLTIQLLQKKLKDSVDATIRETLLRLSNSSYQLKSLVEGLLEYVRSGQKGTNHLVPLEPESLLSKIAQEWTVLASDKNIELRIVCPPGLQTLHSDELKTRVILNNLIVNAIKFTERGFVEIGAQQNSENTILYVKDSGPGIPKADQSRIFEPFERLEPLKRKSIPGMGLGLALVKQLVLTLGARIELESDEGLGSTFRVIFPVS